MDIGKKETALVVRFRGIGDVLMSWFGLETLAKHYDVTYCTSSDAASLFPDNWVNVVIHDWKDHPEEVCPELPRPVLAICHDRMFNLVNAVDWLKSVEGYETIGRARQFARLLGVTPSYHIRQLTPKAEDKDWVSEILREYKKPIVFCQTDSNAETRQWAHWAKLSRLLVDMGCTVVWGGSADKLSPKGVLNYTGATNFQQWVSLIWFSNIVISTCTGALHIAARMQHLKVLGLYGSTSYSVFTEFYRNVKPISNYCLSCSPCHDWQASTACYGHKGAPWCLHGILSKQIAYEVKKLLSAS